MDTLTSLFIDHLSSNVNFYPQQEFLINQTRFTCVKLFVGKSEPQSEQVYQMCPSTKAKNMIAITLISEMRLK